MLPSACWLALVFAAAPQHVDIEVLDKQTSKPMPCRIHLKDAAGKAQRAADLPFHRDHFVCRGSVSLDLPAGTYTYEIERGPEFSRASGKVTIKEGEAAKVKVELERLFDMAAEGWWSGELHIHRPIKDVELLMQADDLHVGPVITWWNSQNQWGNQQEIPDKLLKQFDTNRYYHLMAGEDERGGGALLFFNLPRPLSLPGKNRDHPEYPSPMKFVTEARRYKNAWIDIEKPFWWDTPIWLASGQVDSLGIANNHMCRSEVKDQEAWGKPRDRDRLPPPNGNGLWSQEIYYHVLNTGMRIPPSAGSASGVLPNPVGYNRVYVHVDPKKFDYDSWWENLRAGHSFVTNGPLLRVLGNGELPGHIFTADQGKEVKIELKARLDTQDPIRFVEIVKDGQVERKVPFEEWKKTGSLGTITFEKSGWFLVRAIADNPVTFRFASTAPSYVEIGANKRRISKASAQFFVDWVQERMKRVKVEKAEEREQVLQHHRAAEKFWKQKVAEANAK